MILTERSFIILLSIRGSWESKDYRAQTRRKRHDLSDCRASMVRPCMELQGFARVELKAGETKTVSFRVRADPDGLFGP
ncbi:MAG: fibronectin type III-like domain-contianing protein [Acetatifactor sp.]|nr:fibronectin type III-like domain-contianing protein [Acetatifactor sp.]